ncbi:MAG: DMT family transporter [Candidatus Sumerlaeaceae bacterium]
MISFSSHFAGRMLMLASALSFGVMALLTRILTSVPSAEKVFFRSLFGLILTGAAFIMFCRPLPRPRNYAGLIWRGVFGSLALLCYFYAIDRCGLPKATLYCYTYPVWATLLAWIELGEKPSPHAVAATLVAIVGVALTLDLAQGAALSFSHADAVGLLSGAFTGAAIVSVRRLRQAESSWWIVIFFTATGVFFSAPFLLVSFSAPRSVEWILLSALAATAAIAQLLMTKAYRVLLAAEGSLLSLTVVLWSSLFSVVFLSEVPPLRFWIGASLVFLAVGWLVLHQPTSQSAASTDPPPLD